MKRLWYLSGGMEKFGKENFNESNDWRIRVKEKIADLSFYHITSFNPNEHYNMTSDPKEYTEREVMNLDIYKLRNSELIIYCNNDPYSRGSMIELGIGYERRIPIIVLNPNGNELHSWVKNIAERIFENEDDMVNYLSEHYISFD